MFLPLSTDAQGQIVREVAPAHITLPRPDHPGEVLSLRVALIRDLRRLVPVQSDQADAARPRSFDAHLGPTERQWWEEGWQATAAPAKEMTPKLIPIVTTASTCDAVELAQAYIHRWPAQENVIKDYLTRVRIGHESWLCEDTCGKLRSDQATKRSGKTARQAPTMGTKRRQTHPPGGERE